MAPLAPPTLPLESGPLVDDVPEVKSVPLLREVSVLQEAPPAEASGARSVNVGLPLLRAALVGVGNFDGCRALDVRPQAQEELVRKLALLVESAAREGLADGTKVVLALGMAYANLLPRPDEAAAH